MKTPAADKAASKATAPKVTVDENVVRKMLKVNPTLRQGRTTAQVKKSLERGDSLMGEQVNTASQASASADAKPTLPAGASELRDTMTFFLRGKLEALSAKEAEIEARRKVLETELEAARATFRQQITTFLGLLDQDALATHGPAALAEHAKTLGRLGLDASTLVDLARRGAKS